MPRTVLMILGIVAFSLALCGQKNLTITAPNTGETLQLGNPCTIRWTNSGVTGNVRLLLYRGEGKVDTIVSGVPASQGSWSWTVGRLVNVKEVPAGNGYRIRIVSQDEDRVSDFSDVPFSIAILRAGGQVRGERPKFLLISTPDDGKSLVRHAACSIRWTSSGVEGSVRLAVFAGRRHIGDIASGVPVGQKKFSWTVGQLTNRAYLEENKPYQIRIASQADPGVEDGNTPFTIASHVSIVVPALLSNGILVSRPSNGETLAIGTTATIEWTSPRGAEWISMGDTVRLVAVRQSDNHEIVIRESCDNRPRANSYRWFIQPPVFHDYAGDYRIRVVGRSGLQADSAVFRLYNEDENNSFSVQLVVTRPRRNDVLIIGWANVPVEWNATEAQSGKPIGATAELVAVRQADGRKFRVASDCPNHPGANSFDWFVDRGTFKEFPGDYRMAVITKSGLSAWSDTFRLANKDDPDSRRPENDLALGVVGGSFQAEEVYGTNPGVDKDRYRVRLILRTKNFSRLPSGAPMPEIGKVKCRYRLQARWFDNDAVVADWQNIENGVDFWGDLTLGPVRSEETTEHPIQLDFVIRVAHRNASPDHDKRQFRVYFELDPEHELNDPRRRNNAFHSEAWTVFPQ